MNKNNKLDLQEKQTHGKQTKNKEIQGKSQFTRSKLQRDYQPKIKTFKHKLLKTSEHQKVALQRLQNQRQEQNVASRALQCFKKGEVINLDWKTRTNFRKSQIGLKFPRINTESLHLMIQNQSNKKSNRSNIILNDKSRSTKYKSIEDKCLKLKQLLSPQKGQGKAFFKSQNRTQNNRSQYHLTQSIMLKEQQLISKKTNSKISINKKNIIISSPIAGMSVNISQYFSQQKLQDEKDHQFDFANLRSQTESLQNIKFLQQENQNKSQRDNSLKINKQFISRAKRSLSIEQKSTSQNQQSSNKVTLTTQKKDTAKNSQSYDILNDPSIYLLIGKSRQKIINFKQSFTLKSMTKLQQIKYLEEKRSSVTITDEKDRIRSLSLQGNLNSSKLSKQQIVQKMEAKKKFNFEKLSKSDSRIFTETAQYVKNVSLDQSNYCSQVYQCLSIQGPQSLEDKARETIFEERQSKIKRRKKQSLVQVQQKLLKQVKLSFLKQDLTKKFQEIRQNFPSKPTIIA